MSSVFHKILRKLKRIYQKQVSVSMKELHKMGEHLLDLWRRASLLVSHYISQTGRDCPAVSESVCRSSRAQPPAPGKTTVQRVRQDWWRVNLVDWLQTTMSRDLLVTHLVFDFCIWDKLKLSHLNCHGIAESLDWYSGALVNTCLHVDSDG